MQMSQQVSDLLPELSTPTAGPFLYFRGNSADLSAGPPAPVRWGAHAHIVPLTRLSAPSWQGAGAGKQPWWPEQVHSCAPGSEAALEDGRLQLSPCRLRRQHHLAPSPSLPSSPKALLWARLSSLATVGWQAGALSPAADEKPISHSHWSSHPSSPAALGTQHCSRLEGKSSPLPSPPTGLRAGRVTLHPCCGKRIWGACFWSATSFFPHPSRGFFHAPPLSAPSPAHCVPSPMLHPSLSLSLQRFQQNSFLASHCRPSASTPLGPAHWRGWASSS